MRILKLLAAGLVWFLAFHAAWAKSPPQDKADIRSSSTAAKSSEDEFTPAAEVRASSGPVEIIFRLYKTKIRSGERLLLQLEAKNVGRKGIEIFDSTFKNYYENIETVRKSRTGAYFELQDSAEKVIPWSSFSLIRGDCEYLIRSFPKEVIEDYETRLRHWQKEGLSSEQIDEKKEAFFDRVRDWRKYETPIWTHLEPGESLLSTPWRSPEIRDCHEVTRTPFGPYTELWNYCLHEPGRYRVRAVYDKTISDETLGEVGRGREGFEVRVETPWIEVSVER